MKTTEVELVIIGGGPGGYAAAFDAAQRGLDVTLIEKEDALGGVCLHRGCIPSKAYLHATELIQTAADAEEIGLRFHPPDIDLNRLRTWQQEMVNKLANGLQKRSEQHGLKRLSGRAIFEANDELRVETSEGQQRVKFQHAIIATGSQPAMPKAFDLGNPRIMTSREALQLESVPPRLLVIGGGYIGLELGLVYARLGSSVSLVETMKTLLPGTDEDLVKPLAERVHQDFHAVRLETEIDSLATDGEQIKATLRQGEKEHEEHFDKVLVAVGRKPNTSELGLETTDIETDDNGYIQTNQRQQTAVENVYAIGDVTHGEMLAHKASREAKHAIAALSGESVLTNADLIPAVVYTDPEIAWVGLTEEQAKAEEREIEVTHCSWKSIGRAHGLGATDGLTKLIIEPDTQRILGVGMVGKHVGELISEGALAIQMAATVEDLVETTHPHPTLAESIHEAAANIYRK